MSRNIVSTVIDHCGLTLMVEQGSDEKPILEFSGLPPSDVYRISTNGSASYHSKRHGQSMVFNIKELEHLRNVLTTVINMHYQKLEDRNDRK